MFITMVGNFQDGSVAGKMQYGAPGGFSTKGRNGKAPEGSFSPWIAESFCRYGNRLEKLPLLSAPRVFQKNSM